MKAKSKTKKSPEATIEVLLEKVRPYIKMHGGDVELVEVTANAAVLKIHGACVNCQLADLTYNKILGGLIRSELPQIKKVIIT